MLSLSSMTFVFHSCLILLFHCSCIFFFKQKTAYELRISDLSSDVCSSDLNGPLPCGRSQDAENHRAVRTIWFPRLQVADPELRHPFYWRVRGSDDGRWTGPRWSRPPLPSSRTISGSARLARWLCSGRMAIGLSPFSRSEEHTSELQSLMRISYAVFCLKKKKNKK